MLSENEPCVRNTMPDCSNLVLRWIVSLLPATAQRKIHVTWRSPGVAPTSITASGALLLACIANIAPYNVAILNGVATSPTSQVSARPKCAKKICWWSG